MLKGPIIIKPSKRQDTRHTVTVLRLSYLLLIKENMYRNKKENIRKIYEILKEIKVETETTAIIQNVLCGNM